MEREEGWWAMAAVAEPDQKSSAPWEDPELSPLAGFFRTHPSTDNRIISSLNEQRFLPEKDSYIINTSEFDRVKARLQSIDNAQKLEDSNTGSKEQKRPTLKRRTEDGTPDPNDTGGDDSSAPKKSRPTLKRPNDPDPNPKP